VNDQSKSRWRLIEVAEQVGVSPVTLRRWLLAGKVAEVQRDRNGWRVFTENDIQQIKAFASRVTPPPRP
jgi:DNA (cytosine-5)-methyltransferase 1